MINPGASLTTAFISPVPAIQESGAVSIEPLSFQDALIQATVTAQTGSDEGGNRTLIVPETDLETEPGKPVEEPKAQVAMTPVLSDAYMFQPIYQPNPVLTADTVLIETASVTDSVSNPPVETVRATFIAEAMHTFVFEPKPVSGNPAEIGDTGQVAITTNDDAEEPVTHLIREGETRRQDTQNNQAAQETAKKTETENRWSGLDVIKTPQQQQEASETPDTFSQSARDAAHVNTARPAPVVRITPDTAPLAQVQQQPVNNPSLPAGTQPDASLENLQPENNSTLLQAQPTAVVSAERLTPVFVSPVSSQPVKQSRPVTEQIVAAPAITSDTKLAENSHPIVYPEMDYANYQVRPSRQTAEVRPSASPTFAIQGQQQVLAVSSAADAVRSVETPPVTSMPEPDRARSAHAVEQVVKAVELTVNRNVTDLTVQLDPPELGAVKVKISMIAGQISAQIRAESASTHQMIWANQNDLKEALIQAGLRLERIHIPDFGASFNQFAHTPQHNSGGQNQRQPGRSAFIIDPADEIHPAASTEIEKDALGGGRSIVNSLA